MKQGLLMHTPQPSQITIDAPPVTVETTVVEVQVATGKKPVVQHSLVLT
jgi:hypothetical protein